MTHEPPTPTLNCGVCGEEMLVDSRGDALIGRDYVTAIRDATEHAMAHPTCNAREGYDMEYVVKDGYYPGDKSHYIDISDFPAEHRGGAFLDAQSMLVKRGLVINSVKWGSALLHVVTLDWATEREQSNRQRLARELE
jgi:hypothetical protein